MTDPIATPTEPYVTCVVGPDDETLAVTVHNVSFVGEGDIGLSVDGRVTQAAAQRAADAILAVLPSLPVS